MSRTSNVASQIAKLQKKLALLQKKEADNSKLQQAKALAAIVKLAKGVGLTADDIAGALKSGKAPVKKKATAKKSANAGKSVAPKYRNPANPEQTWTGRGKSPTWITELKAAGTLENALISL